jgi:hypothetical protein
MTSSARFDGKGQRPGNTSNGPGGGRHEQQRRSEVVPAGVRKTPYALTDEKPRVWEGSQPDAAVRHRSPHGLRQDGLQGGSSRATTRASRFPIGVRPMGTQGMSL